MNYDDLYQQMVSLYAGTESRKNLIRNANRILTFLFYCLYPLLILILLIQRSANTEKIILVPAVSFVIVSAFRRGINRKRPYETWSIQPVIIKNKKGSSFPSRHVFSSAVIAMCWLYCFPLAGVILLVLALISGWIRVLGGVHYPSDVICGYLIGAGCGLLLWIL